MEKSKKGGRYIFIAGSLWGTIGLFVTIMNQQGSNPALSGFLRLSLAFVLLFAFTVLRFGIRSFLVDPRTLFFSALLGLISHGINNWAYANSVTVNGLSLAAVILHLAPFFTALWSVLLFRERISPMKGLAILINLTGCTLAVTGGKFTGFTITLSGLFFGLGAALTYSLNPVIGRYATRKTNPFVVSTYCFFFAAIFLALVARPWQADIPWNAPLLRTAFFYALFSTAVAFAFYYAGVQRIQESSRIPIIASVELIVATFIGVGWFRETIGIPHAIGILLVLGSILLLNWPMKQKKE